MRRTLAAIAAICAALVLIGFAASRRHRGEIVPGPTHEAPPSPEVVSAVSIEAEHKVGAGRSFDELTVFPILAEEQPDLGPFVTLEQALEAKTAEVREAGEAGGGRVNSLVIENKGTAPIFVLAGTVVKGGKQDRQIGQDFAVGAQQTVAVDAFCVERGRWNAQREGVLTQGKFGTSKSLATSGVRAAGQYKKSQGEVWSKVGEVNARNGKSTPTDTLAASLDDQDLAGKRASLAQTIAAHVNGLAPQREVVGIAYAVEGKVRGVRWFANHRLYELYRDSLFNTAALEAITARGAAGGPKKEAAPPPSPEAVKAFVTEIQTAQVAEERSTPGENVNAYKESKQGYGSTASFKSTPQGFGTAKPRGKMSISSDFTAK
jgi:hypothetical protein